ncbi:MAG: hypothetical protein R3B13_39825 [Polyangiaceae bacterium]
MRATEGGSEPDPKLLTAHALGAAGSVLAAEPGPIVEELPGSGQRDS